MNSWILWVGCMLFLLLQLSIILESQKNYSAKQKIIAKRLNGVLIYSDSV